MVSLIFIELIKNLFIITAHLAISLNIRPQTLIHFEKTFTDKKRKRKKKKIVVDAMLYEMRLIRNDDDDALKMCYQMCSAFFIVNVESVINSMLFTIS